MKKILPILLASMSVYSANSYAQTAFQEALQNNLQKDADKYGYKHPELMNKKKEEMAAADTTQKSVEPAAAPITTDNPNAVKAAVVPPTVATNAPKSSIVGSFKNSLGGKNASETKRTPLVEMKTFDEYRKNALDTKEAKEGKVLLP